MKKPLNNFLCSNRRLLYSRREILEGTSCGFGWLAFSMLAGQQAFATNANSSGDKPTLPTKTHFPAKAKRVIFICLKGGPSHVDTFDYKPELKKQDGKAAVRPGSKWMGSPWKFVQKGESGLWLSELFPHLAEHTDKLCMIHSMQTEVPAHAQAMVRMHTGSSQFVRPSVGAWTLYGLGTENENIPGFISISPAGGSGGSQNYGNGFLPASYQGTRIGAESKNVSESKIANLAPAVGPTRQKLELDFIQSMNQDKLNNEQVNPELEGSIKSYELAFRMQGEMPKVMDLSQESESTKRMYGMDNRKSSSFGAKCVMARRFIESGVRFVEITHGNWDHHFNIETALPDNCEQIDHGIAGLLADLQQRGLLESTLIVCTGEFGRTPYAQAKNGRDHNNKAFTLWMAGGGVRPGMSYGSSGEFGYEAVEKPVPIVDFHATMLALLGFDHEKLTYRHAGRDFRLTDVKGKIIRDLIG